MERCYTDYENIGKFISNISGNWRNSIYITCSACKNEKQPCCDDVLVSFDTEGTPTFITVKDANFIFATIIDKSECLCEMSNGRFVCLFEGLIKRKTFPEKGCPLLQLTKDSKRLEIFN